MQGSPPLSSLPAAEVALKKIWNIHISGTLYYWRLQISLKPNLNIANNSLEWLIPVYLIKWAIIQDTKIICYYLFIFKCSLWETMLSINQNLSPPRVFKIIGWFFLQNTQEECSYKLGCHFFEFLPRTFLTAIWFQNLLKNWMFFMDKLLKSAILDVIKNSKKWHRNL